MDNVTEESFYVIFSLVRNFVLILYILAQQFLRFYNNIKFQKECVSSTEQLEERGDIP